MLNVETSAKFVDVNLAKTRNKYLRTPATPQESKIREVRRELPYDIYPIFITSSVLDIMLGNMNKK